MWNKKNFNDEKARILREILDKYHFNSGIDITDDRFFIVHRPEQIERLHHEFARLAIAYVPPEREKDYMEKLIDIRDKLKNEYDKLKNKERRK